MAIEKTKYVERVLIVLNPDGTLAGAHQETLSRVMDGEDVLSAKQLPAVPLDAGTLAAVLPSQSALAAQLAEVQALAASLQQRLTAEEEQRAAATARAETAEANASVATARAETAEASAAEAQARIAALEPSAVVNGVPQTVTPYQARKALKAGGLLTQVMAMIAALPEDDDVRLAWEWAVVWDRTSPFVAQFGAALGQTSDQIDALFIAAKQVT